MHGNYHLVERRIKRAMRERIGPAAITATAPLTVTSWQAPGRFVPFDRLREASFEAHSYGTAWGPPWTTTWFRFEGTVPAAWTNGRIEAHIDLGFDARRPGFQAEGMAYDLRGTPIKGLSSRNRHVPLATATSGDKHFAILVEAAANPEILTEAPAGDDFRWRFLPTFLGDSDSAGEEPLYRLEAAELVWVNDDAWSLACDVDALVELLESLGSQDSRRYEVLSTLDRALDIVDRDGVAAGAREARACLEPALSRPAHASAQTLYAIGHAHIDSAWLWPLEETVRKASRTFANVIQLMDEFPDLVFACSQAQQYSWVKHHQPHIYERIREAVADGRWVPVGGMWVEADANLPGGEALVRQFTYGQRFFREEFGIECEEVWLPDSFGYTAAFPQIARLAGARWFLTQKLSWNETNRFPHHTFWWEGIDGTRIFTHFPPVDTYAAELSGQQLSHAATNFAEKGRATRSLVPFGYGDGGGGPTREMLERAQRFADLEGMPRVVLASPRDFFEAAESEYPDAPVWKGELYLEAHRGTFTSQARTKAGNRRSEHLLREAELWAATAAMASGQAYPGDAIDELWKQVLLHQFHDILPGSSISQVHREAHAAYERIASELESLIDAALQPFTTQTALVANSAPHFRREIVRVQQGTIPDGPHQQALADGRVAFIAEVEATALAQARPVPSPEDVIVEGRSLRNSFLHVDLDADGLITSIRDLQSDREVVPTGLRANLLRVHPDHPARWDAWDVDRSYRHTGEAVTTATSVEVAEDGPLVGTIRVERTFGDSKVSQSVSIAAGSPRIDLEIEIDWVERERFLKLELPVDIHPDRASSEIQFGHIDRPVHSNTSSDEARFETYAHRWLHVAEPGYGIAVVNDAIYGHDVASETDASGHQATTIRLSLLRGARFPDPGADLGHHRFSVGLIPNASLATAAEHGLNLNLPLRVLEARQGTSECAMPSPIVTTEHPGVEIDAIKMADDRSGDLIVRLHERLGGRHQTVLRTARPVRMVHECDLLERRVEEIAIGPTTEVPISLRPFQILTLRLANHAATPLAVDTEGMQVSQ